MTKEKNGHQDDIFTIPNIMTMFRIMLIPVFMFLFFREHEIGCLIVVGVSALTDILDGIIARKFNMVSSLGKALDPIADKLSLLALMLCLVFRFRPILVLAILIIVKELTQGIFGLVAVKKSGKVKSAGWHGKVTTEFLYATLMLHLLWRDIPLWLTWTLIAVSACLMVFSLTMYIIRYVGMIREGNEARKKEEENPARPAEDIEETCKTEVDQ